MSYENELPLDTPYNTELDDPANAAYTDLKEEIENVVSIIEPVHEISNNVAFWHV